MKTIDLLNTVCWWACLVPGALIMAIAMIRIGLRARSEPAGHKHDWKYDPDGSTVDIPPVQPNPPYMDKLPMGVFPPDHYGTYHDHYVCDCGEEKTETHRDLY